MLNPDSVTAMSEISGTSQVFDERQYTAVPDIPLEFDMCIKLIHFVIDGLNFSK